MSRETDGAVGIRLSFEALLGQLNETLGSMTGGLEKIHKFMSENPTRTPIQRTIAGNAVAAASALTYTFMDMGGPSYGYRRSIRWFTVFGPDPTQTLSGVTAFAFMAGAGQFQDSNTEPAAFAELTTIAASTVPNRWTSSEGELTILPGRRLIVCFKSLANNQAVNGYGQAWDYKESTLVAEPV